MRLTDGVRAFIEQQRVARLATVDASARPHVVPICFALDENTLYTPIDEKPKAADYQRLRRLRNIAANQHVQVVFDTYDDRDWSRLSYAQIRGTARILASGGEYARAVELLRARYTQYRSMSLERRPVIAIDIDRVVVWRGAPPDPSSSV